MHYSNASNPCALFEQVILKFFPQREKHATSRAHASVELIYICSFPNGLHTIYNVKHFFTVLGGLYFLKGSICWSGFRDLIGSPIAQLLPLDHFNQLCQVQGLAVAR